jgi:excisionase family DNA binding protein
VAAPAAAATYPGVLLVTGDLPPHLDAVVREALANGARLTVMSLHPSDGPAAVSAGDRPPLTAAEAAAHYRVEPATVRAWCREGRFPGAERLGKSWRIPAAAVHDRRPPAPAAGTTAASAPAAGARTADATTPAGAVPDAPRQRGRRDPAAKERPPADGFDRTALSAWRTAK